jgi:hypothetical protein
LEEGGVRAEVARGASGLFVVRTPSGDVAVMGTVFEVKAYRYRLPRGGEGSASIVYLDEGRLAMGNELGGLELKEGRTGVLVSGHPPMYSFEEMRSGEPSEGWLRQYLAEDRDPALAVGICLAFGERIVPHVKRLTGEPGRVGALARVILETLETWNSERGARD